ncbi:MAG: phosphopyruvate hydratase [Patescibacteria group bacterium]|nr:phosphopyruvate hydratase [Patescibacteria group bacterium]
MMKIKDIRAIEILDSRGIPTLRTFIFLDNGVITSSSIPSGASTGSHEALELRDNDEKRYFGKGVLKAIANVNERIKKLIVGKKAEPEEIDKLLIKEDGTTDKSVFGANAILSVSQSLVRALALAKKIPLWRFINDYYSFESFSFPRLMVNVINGGKHANWNFDIQEFMISPKTNKPSEAVRIASEIFHQIGKLLKEKKLSVLVGDEGGFSPNLSSNEAVFDLILEAAEKLGYQNGTDFNLAIDAAASEFFQKERYVFKKENRFLTGDELIDYYWRLKEKYEIFSFEDPFSESDWESFAKFTKSISPTLVVGDDNYTTDPKLIKKGIEEKTTNAVLIKLNQIGTVLETVEAVKLAKKNNWQVVISHRSGETEDAFIADFAYGVAADFIKTGSMCRSERLAKYNRLIEIENSL